jgi:hypothetical protein
MTIISAIIMKQNIISYVELITKGLTVTLIFKCLKYVTASPGAVIHVRYFFVVFNQVSLIVIS